MSLSSFSLSFHSAAASEPVTTAVVGSVTNPTSYVCTAYVCEQQCKPQRTTIHPRLLLSQAQSVQPGPLLSLCLLPLPPSRRSLGYMLAAVPALWLWGLWKWVEGVSVCVCV